jgi:hypothetical protein
VELAVVEKLVVVVELAVCLPAQQHLLQVLLTQPQ